ncbi:acetyl-CoA carboxylase biotin carboxyl carrier protein subunit [Dysgonomonas sp. 520]|uniref:acetyl-CoA carboxylase biotin carboxyl carrier protein subunit n=1 Tax=Dysgonomonas sp. 520 TaxID=2302931 RepID=UPI0013D872AE|nr:acetyl-CoA carboxylase biotin carboxyl carrier protein subunit [Dysgonomonas sp. 520]NDW08542.1 acetyl-CoA carboxylase biotin carboxyl carrier protein subunit [Dysgonomonas sp. 520]
MNTLNKQLIALNKESNKEYNFLLREDGKVEFDSKILDEIAYPIEIISNHQNEYELLVNGVSYSFSVETPFSLQRKKMLTSQASESTTIRLKAPMPGKILEVMVKTGDMVKAGDTLLILEAMKMQNAILASTKGTIKKVLIKEGDTTSKSDLLIELEKEV